MTWLYYLPLCVIGAVSLVILAPPYSHRLDRLISRFALMTFGRYVDTRAPRPERVRLLEMAYFETPYRAYTSWVLLSSSLAALAGSIVGVYLVAGFFVAVPAARELAARLLPVEPDSVAVLLSVPDLAPGTLFMLLLFSSATVGVASWLGVYWLLWWLPEFRAQSRRQYIELGMPSMIAFMYALARGGLELPRVLAILQQHQSLYGEAAAEMAIASKAVNGFGTDVVTAIRDVSSRTPSEQFRIFTENLASVLQSGRSITEFLSDQYEYYNEEAKTHQELFLERLGAVVEVYVAVFVVGPLFLLTVLLVFGLISGGTAGAMAAIIYGMMPVINLAFIYYLDRSAQPLGMGQSDVTSDEPARRFPAGEMAAPVPSAGAVSDPAARGAAVVDAPQLQANFERLAVSSRMRGFRQVLSEPIAQVRRKPATILYAAGPLAILWLLGNAVLLDTRGTLTLTAMDDVFIQSTLIVVLPFGLARRQYTARLRSIDRVVPDLFTRLASLNQAGVEIVDAIEQVRHGNLGPLTPELNRLWTDIQFGADVETALRRFERRTGSPSVRRAMTLISKGLTASGNLGPVLRIAADEARRVHSLKRQREQEMSIYLVIIYLAFLVFLTIVFVLIVTFIPAIPSQAALESSGLGGAAAGITQAQASQYQILLFHASLVQAIFSGLIAGQMSQGSVRDGAIHVVILVAIAYGLFSLVA